MRLLVRSAFIVAATSSRAASRVASSSVRPSFFLRKFAFTVARSVASERATYAESRLLITSRYVFSRPAMTASSALATYFLTSAAQSSAMWCSFSIAGVAATVGPQARGDNGHGRLLAKVHLSGGRDRLLAEHLDDRG